MSELCRFTTMGPQALKDSTLNTQHCRCCYGLTPWPQWTWNSSQVGFSDRHFFFFELTSMSHHVFPEAANNCHVADALIRYRAEIFHQVRILPKYHLRWKFSEDFQFLVRIPSCPLLLLVIPAYLHPDSVFVHNSHFKYIWHHCRANN